MPRLYRLDSVVLACHDQTRRCVTTLPGGRQAPAVPHSTDDYRRKAAEWGAEDAWHLAWSHELTHSLLAVYAGLPASPVLLHESETRAFPLAVRLEEERLVEECQRLLLASGKRLREVAS